MKELVTKKFWQGVKKTFDEARQGRPSTGTSSQAPEGNPNRSSPVEALATARAACLEPAGILFDLDGILYDADRLISGAVETAQWVQSERVPHLFVTNTTSPPRADRVSTLASFDIAQKGMSQSVRAEDRNYTGINAAYMNFALREDSESLVGQVLEIARAAGRNYWAVATVPECQLLLRNYSGAEQTYVAASQLDHASRHWSTTGQQALDIIARHGNPPEAAGVSRLFAQVESDFARQRPKSDTARC